MVSSLKEGKDFTIEWLQACDQMSNDVIGAITEVNTKSHGKREGSREEGRKVSTGFKEEARHELSFDKWVS